MPSRKKSADVQQTSGVRFATVAVRYALGRWEALLRFCNDGGIEIDNNAAERALRVVAPGRKNFLFAGSDGGGESAAAISSSREQHAHVAARAL